MRTKEEILKKIEKIKADDRMKGYGTDDYKPANVQVNEEGMFYCFLTLEYHVLNAIICFKVT